MGVRGLTSFIAKDSNRYLKPTLLHDTTLVIDGNCIASHLFKWNTKRDSAFGGDYDEYHLIVKKFFITLKKCNIVPIVIFDGGYEDKKLKTVFIRLKKKLHTLKNGFNRSFSREKFFPIFMKQVFWDAVESLKVKLIQTEFEADEYIAKLARCLHCPVLSYDSDFYIFDAMYIPFSTVELEAAFIDKNQFGLQCSMYKVEDFLKEYPGLNKSHLPLIATVLGNDFVDSCIFNKFFDQIPQSRNKTSTRTERKIVGLLNWMKHESETSAVSKILMHLCKKDNDAVLVHIQAMKIMYKTCDTVYGKDLNELTITALICDNRVKRLLTDCKLPSWIIDMLQLRVYFSPLQVEDFTQTSAHCGALYIIEIIYSLLCSSENCDNLKVYMRQGKSARITFVSIANEPRYLETILSEPISQRRKFIFQSLKLEDNDMACLEDVYDDSFFFLCCLVSWCKNSVPSNAHVHALFLSFLASQAKYRVGMCKVGKESDLSDSVASEFSSVFTAFRKTSESSRLNYNVNTVHIFNIFQSIAYHALVLNTLVDYPLKPFKMADMFNGTLTYNLYADLSRREDILKYLNTFIQPNEMATRYMALCDKLCRFFPLPTTTSVMGLKKKRRRKGKNRTKKDIEEVDKNTEESVDEYDDLSNQYYLLRI